MYRHGKLLILSGALFASSFFLSVGAEAASGTLVPISYQVHVQVDNRLIDFPDAQPFIDQNNRTQVPVSFVSETLGFSVDWDRENEQVKVILKNENKEIVLRTGSNRAIVNGKSITLDTSAVLWQDRTFVPINFVSKALGANVDWDKNSGTAVITTGNTGAGTNLPIASRSGFPTVASSQPSKPNVTEIALKYSGTPYKWAGTSPEGFDCSGYVNYVFKEFGVELPRTSFEMYEIGTSVTDLQPGDLVFFNTYDEGASHVGIYLGKDQFISATSNAGVKIQSINDSYWGPRYLGAKRL